MNTTTGTVLADGDIGVAREGPPPTGGNFLPLMHYGGGPCSLFAFSGLSSRPRGWPCGSGGSRSPEKFIGLVLLGTVLGGAAGAMVGSVF